MSAERDSAAGSLNDYELRRGRPIGEYLLESHIPHPISHIRLLRISYFGSTGPRGRGSSTPMGCFLKGRVLRARILYLKIRSPKSEI